ncbi:MAG TPA: WD40 repeat domain-containing serine/threonine protein kinase [Candidatus Acidoferrum sp.]|jgi:serine/threonine protein kinase
MPFASDTALGPYKIVALIGSGGMGEVYRAHDTRLRRDVALKILPASFTNDPDRLRRFEQEARAVAALNHPNIVSIYDVGEANGVHYIVSELLEGESLRERIPAAGMPTRKAIELAVQFANGLAVAHDRGIVHRDLKPENLFVNKTGQVKILDFGLAKLRDTQTNGAGNQSSTGISNATVVDAHTSAGQILGTVGYMSPEQVRGDAVDHRSDIFSFGSILYEMLCGQRAFKRNTSAETMTAILNEDPQDFSRTNLSSPAAIPPALERIVRHCLEKQPAQRFQSAHDIAFDLESVSSVSSTGPAASSGAARRRRWLVPAVAGVALLAVGAALGAFLRPAPAAPNPKTLRITFRRGTIWNARFTPDGNLVYSASWDGTTSSLFSANPGSTESRPLSSGVADIFAVSPSGELAVGIGHRFQEGFEFSSMLARQPLGGAAPRDVIDGVEYADWSPDGSNIAVIRRVVGKVRIEYPIGKVLYETPGWVSHLRISPNGKLIAFVDHPYTRDDGGFVATVDSSGNKKIISDSFVSLQGLAWRPDGDEIWFTGTKSGSNRELRGVTLGGKERLVYLGTGTLTLHDISKQGRILFTRDDWRAGMVGLGPGAKSEIDLSWHDWTVPRDVSDDGKIVSFDETGEAGGETGTLYIRPTDGSPAIRLGDGTAPSLSPDGKWVLALVPGPDGKRHLSQFPTGAGESHAIDTGDVQVHQAYFFPDGHRVLEEGNAAGENGVRMYIHDLNGGSPRPLGPQGVSFRYRRCISSDGKLVAALDPDRRPAVYDVATGKATLIPGVLDGDEPVQWIDEKHIIVGRTEVPMHVFTIDLFTGKRTPLKTFSPMDPTGLIDNAPPTFSSDLKSYVYSYSRITSDLYVLDGLK